jgi:hypothetical protein
MKLDKNMQQLVRIKDAALLRAKKFRLFCLIHY